MKEVYSETLKLWKKEIKVLDANLVRVHLNSKQSDKDQKNNQQQMLNKMREKEYSWFTVGGFANCSNHCGK